MMVIFHVMLNSAKNRINKFEKTLNKAYSQKKTWLHIKTFNISITDTRLKFTSIWPKSRRF